MEIGKLQDFTIDQFAGSLALILGSIGGLLMIIWKSRCECDMNCCYIIRCHRKPPPENQDSDEEDPEKTTLPSQQQETQSNPPEVSQTLTD